MCQYQWLFLGFAFLGFGEFGIKSCGIAGQDTSHGILSLFFVFGGVKTNQAPTIGSTKYLNGKALTIELEAFGFFTGASHIRYFISMRQFDLTGRCGSLPTIDISE